jgi:ABC-type uncharacterized transport system auxiliary subunit
MLMRSLLIFAVLCATILVGCSKTETTENSNTAMGNSNKTTTTTNTTTPTTTTTASTGEKIGVPECDDFIAKYESCISSSKVPEAQQAQLKSAIAEWRKQWKTLAENPLSKAAAAAACKQAAAQQETALKQYGCKW